MSPPRLRLPSWPALALALGCGAKSQPAPAESARLPAGIVARAGQQLVAVPSLAKVAEQQALSPQAALPLLLSDALLAQAARELLPTGTVSVIERAAAARALLEQLGRDAAGAGPPTSAELDQVVHDRWVELERPDAVRTTHAVVINGKPEGEAAARALAQKLAEAVKPATSAEDFLRIARAFPAQGLSLRAEALPPVTRDGRTFEQRDGKLSAAGPFDPAFAAAANDLEQPGQQSPVIKSSFGFHVIRLEERIPGISVAKSELATLLAPEVRARRAERARRELLERLQSGVSIERDRAVDELTSRVPAAP